MQSLSACAIMAFQREEKRNCMSWPVLFPAFEHLDSSERVHTAWSSLPTMHCQQKLPKRLGENGSSQSPMAKDSAHFSPQNIKGASDKA